MTNLPYLKFKNKILVLILVFVFLFSLSGCKSAQLKMLEGLVSRLQLATGHEITRSTQNAEAGFTGPVYAEIFIQYESLEQYTKEDVYNEIITTLTENGWQRLECNECGTDTFKASLSQSDYPLPVTVLVHLYSSKNLVSIRITHPKP